MNSVEIGSRVLTAKGIEGTITQILDGGYLLDGGQRVRAGSIAQVISSPQPPKLPIGTKVKLTVTIDRRIDGHVGKVVDILSPTLRRVRWQLWEESIERNFQLSYLREVD